MPAAATRAWAAATFELATGSEMMASGASQMVGDMADSVTRFTKSVVEDIGYDLFTDRTLRMTALAARTNGSLTRMSHVVTRLEQRGIVARSACALDGRATNVTLTDAGHDALVAAAPGHVTQVRESFLDALSPAQLGQLDAICDAILDRIDPEGKMTTR